MSSSTSRFFNPWRIEGEDSNASRYGLITLLYPVDSMLRDQRSALPVDTGIPNRSSEWMATQLQIGTLKGRSIRK